VAQQSWPWDTGAVLESGWRDMAAHWVDTGVLAGELNSLEPFGDSSGMQVKVKTGKAWIKGHYYVSDTEVTLPIATANATNPRIDRVTVRADFGANSIVLAVVQGTPAASPALPPLTQTTAVWEIPVAEVTVAAGAVTIAASAVVDGREQVATKGDRFDPGAVGLAPSFYPVGLTIGLVATADGWPVTGTLTTYRRSGSRIWQELVKADSGLGGVERSFRQGYYGSAGPNGWGPWQRTVDSSGVSESTVSTEESTTSTGYVSLATGLAVASVTVGPSGKALVAVTARMRNATAGEMCYASVAVSGASTVSASDATALLYESSAANDYARMSSVFLLTGLTAGANTFTMQHRVTAGTGFFANRRLTVIAL
jgi:hypothetical protein